MMNKRLSLRLDKWQKEVLETKGNVALVSGRQVGKSTIWAVDASEYAVSHANKLVLMIASVERQAFGLFEKTLAYLYQHHKKIVRTGKDRPTKSKIRLKNGTEILCLPTGLDGHGIRFLTADRLYGDEAAFIPEEVWTAVTPMLAMTGGVLRLSSTPHGKGGYFHKCCTSRESFKVFHVNTQEVVEGREISETWTVSQRDSALAHLKEERGSMTELKYAQEYMGEFTDALMQVFPDELIIKCMTLTRRKNVKRDRKYYLGVDIARMGNDESTFEIIDRTNRTRLEHIENQITKKTLTTATTERIIALDNIYHFRQIFVDDGGMGVGVFDQLLTTDSTKRKVIAINNSSRPLVPLTSEERQKKRVLKEDIFNNLLSLMERGQIFLLKDPEIFQSLKSVQFEIKDNKVKYTGTYTHIADGLVRAAWCVKDKRLNIYAY